MSTQPEFSGRDESLAMGLYTGISQVTVPHIHFTYFDYTIRPRRLLDGVAATFGKSLSLPLPPEHRTLLESGEEQSPEDLVLVEHMQEVQRNTLT